MLALVGLAQQLLRNSIHASHGHHLERAEGGTETYKIEAIHGRSGATTNGAMPLWLYALLCVVVPAVWGVAMYYAFTALKKRPAQHDDPPPIDYSI